MPLGHSVFIVSISFEKILALGERSELRWASISSQKLNLGFASIGRMSIARIGVVGSRSFAWLDLTSALRCCILRL